jgi:oligopeptide transport system substrate-binding protein
MGKRINLPLILAVLSVIGFLSGCKRPFSDRAEDLSVFRFSENGAPISMDPVQGSSQYANLMNTSIFDTLYEYKYLARPYELKPQLAESLPEVSEDGLTYTFRIKQGIEFSDDECFPDGIGREVIAEDFVYSIKRMFDPKTQPQGAWLWQGRIVGLDDWKDAGSDYSAEIEGLKAIDRYTIQVKLTQPYPQLTYTFAMGYSGVVPREAVEHYGKEFGINPVGSGPFVLQSFSTKKAILKRNPKFREEYFDLEYEGYDPATQKWANLELLDGRRMPIMDTVEVYFMRESMTRWNSLNKGNEIHLGTIPIELTHMVTDSVKPLELKPQYADQFNGMNLPDFGFVYFLFNMEDPRIGYHPDPEQNRRNLLLRKAIRAGYDWEQRNKRFYNNVADVFPGVLPRGLDAFDETIPMDSVTADYEQAKAYLAEGGWTPENLPELEYHSGTGVVFIQMFEQFRGWMEKIGYPREKISLELHATFGDLSKAMKNKELMVWGMGWGLDYPDSENILQLFYGPNKSPGSNSANYDNEAFNELFRKAKILQPGPERTELYKEMNRMIIDDVPVIAGLTRNSPYIWHKNVVFHHSRNPHGSLLKYAYIATDAELEALNSKE